MRIIRAREYSYSTFKGTTGLPRARYVAKTLSGNTLIFFGLVFNCWNIEPIMADSHKRNTELHTFENAHLPLLDADIDVPNEPNSNKQRKQASRKGERLTQAINEGVIVGHLVSQLILRRCTGVSEGMN